jgi:hypothetical protein
MATNTAGTNARLYHTDQVHYFAKNIAVADGNAVVHTMGVLPAGAVILKGQSGVLVHVAFNAGTGNVLDVGTSADDDLYGTDLALGAVAQVALDEAVDYRIAADTTITATVALSGTQATTGAATVIIAYLLPGR